MKLIRFEAKGFKSFAEKIRLNFNGNIVGIAGPNGSGKSNINDAIKWVLGEQSSKSLRGDSMEDVIFSGSKTVKALDKAEVTLTFDNKDQEIKIPSNKIVITRVIKRGLGSKYYINGEIAKLRQIKEITMATGIAKSSLAIISQGTISSIAQSTAEERRAIFEEAAGTSKYKKRKIEALKKLEFTSEALDKMKTIIHELDKQLAPLSRQAEKAKIYLEKSKKLKDVEVALIADEVSFYKNILKDLEIKLKTIIFNKEEYEDQISEIEASLDSKNSYKLTLENETIELQNKLDTVSNKLWNIESVNSKEEHSRKMMLSGKMKTSSQEQKKAMYEELSSLGSKIQGFKKISSSIEDSIIAKRKEIDSFSEELNNFNYDGNQLQNKLYKMRSKLEVVSDYKNNKSNLFLGTKTIIKNKSAFPGVFNIVGELISVDTMYQTAIETILQNSLQNVVVDNSGTAIKCVNFLKTNNGGRATFIPLESIRPKKMINEYYYAIQSQKGFIDIASNIVQADKKFQTLKEFLLGHIIIVDNIENANVISSLIDKRYMVITLEGDIIRVGGVISGGQKSREKHLLNLDKQIVDYKELIIQLEKEVKTYKVTISQKEIMLTESQSLISEFYIEQAKIKEKLELTQDNFNSLKINYESITNKKIKLDEFTETNEDLASMQTKRTEFQQTLKVKRTKIIQINNELSIINIRKNEVDKLLRNLIDKSSKQMTDKVKAEFYIENSLQRLSEAYEMTLEFAVTNFSLEISKEEAKEIVKTLRKDIKDLGYININALEQYEEVKGRHTELNKNKDELDKAQELILSAISEMDQIMIVKFDTTVKSVQKFLQPIFSRMFGGGEIRLQYTNSTNILETGIDVIAQPPGKAVRNLKLFSGGEKSLIAISLLFAILKFKPLPLCILDEVEAALDEANVSRYADFLQELKGKTQFMIITHRIGTMEKVDELFGVTMQQRGVTSIFSLKLEKAKALFKNNDKKEL